jgi:rhodanese-related sulfurtransferase
MRLAPSPTRRRIAVRPREHPIVLALLWPLAGPAPTSAQAPTVDAPTGHALPAAGGVLVDARSPREVAATARPAGAVLVPLQDDDRTVRGSFVADVAAAVGPDRTRPVALIDADGRRAAHAAKLLASQGFTGVLVVGEGMLGSNLSPGWLARDLPVEP